MYDIKYKVSIYQSIRLWDIRNGAVGLCFPDASPGVNVMFNHGDESRSSMSGFPEVDTGTRPVQPLMDSMLAAKKASTGDDTLLDHLNIMKLYFSIVFAYYLLLLN